MINLIRLSQKLVLRKAVIWFYEKVLGILALYFDDFRGPW